MGGPLPQRSISDQPEALKSPGHEIIMALWPVVMADDAVDTRPEAQHTRVAC